MKKNLSFFALGLISLFCGCSRPQNDAIDSYQSGQFSSAEQMLDQRIYHEMPRDNYTLSNDAVVLLLNRATIRFASGDAQGAIEDYRLAIEAMDFYAQPSISESLGKIALQDDLGGYVGDDFEQVLARVYFALALLQVGDNHNALALLKQAEEIQQLKCEDYRKDRLTQNYELAKNPVAKYLMASLLEHRGDHSNAEILFAQTEQLLGVNLSSLQLRNKELPDGKATVIIVAHNGNAPYKISGTSEASRASALALEIMLGSSSIPPAYSSLVGIPVPILMQQIVSHSVPIFSRLCRQEKRLLPFYNITAASAYQLEQSMPIIVARGVARLVLRRGTVAFLNEHDPFLGSLADMGMLVANACTQADTRSWRTLPSTIDLTRYDIPPGEHTLHLQVHWGIIPPLIEEFPIRLEANDLCVINIFNIHPGIVTVQIPDHCKNNIKKEPSYDLPASHPTS